MTYVKRHEKKQREDNEMVNRYENLGEAPELDNIMDLYILTISWVDFAGGNMTVEKRI